MLIQCWAALLLPWCHFSRRPCASKDAGVPGSVVVDADSEGQEILADNEVHHHAKSGDESLDRSIKREDGRNIS